VKRQLTMPVGVIWLITVVATWVATTPVLALLIRTTDSHSTAAHVIGQAAASATFACIIVGGPATAVALRGRRRRSGRRAVLGGLATAVLVLLFFWSYVAATGTSVPWAWQALLPLIVVTAAQLSLALRLRRHCRDEAPPEPTPPEQTPPGQAPPGRAKPA
jgi:peptidoglycan/LPS O-acetylase OafA/YrhL